MKQRCKAGHRAQGTILMASDGISQKCISMHFIILHHILHHVLDPTSSTSSILILTSYHHVILMRTTSNSANVTMFSYCFHIGFIICIPCCPCVPVPCPYDDPYAQCPHLAAQLPGFRGRGGQLFAPQAASLLGTPGARQTAHVRHRLTGLGLSICIAFGFLCGLVAPPLVFPGVGWHRHDWNLMELKPRDFQS